MDPRAAFIHQNALCESEHVGTGTRIWAFAHVMASAHVGEHCNIGDHAFIETGAVVGNRVTVKNGVMIWDRVVIDDDVFVGPGVVFTNDLDPRAAHKKTRVGSFRHRSAVALPSAPTPRSSAASSWVSTRSSEPGAW